MGNHLALLVSAKVGKNKTMDFLLRNYKKVSIANADVYQYIKTIYTNSGTVGTIDTNGAPTGNDYNVNRIPHEDAKGVYVAAGFATVKEHNVKELIETAVTMYTESISDSPNIVKITNTLKSMSFKDELINEMSDAIEGKIVSDFIAWLIAGESATVYDSDIIFAGSAQPIWPNANKLSGAYTASNQKLLHNIQQVQKNHQGQTQAGDGIDTVFCDKDVNWDITSLLYPDRASNIQSRNLANPNGDIAIISATVTANDSFIFGTGHGFEFVADDVKPRILINPAGHGNLEIMAKQIYTFSLAHRLDLFMCNNA